MKPHPCNPFKLLKSRSKALISNFNLGSGSIGPLPSLLIRTYLKLYLGEDLHRDTINFRILGYSIFLAFVSVILAITLMKRYCECCYDDPKRTDDLNISYWSFKIYALKGSRSTLLLLLLISMPNILNVLIFIGEFRANGHDRPVLGINYIPGIFSFCSKEF